MWFPVIFLKPPVTVTLYIHKVQLWSSQLCPLAVSPPFDLSSSKSLRISGDTVQQDVSPCPPAVPTQVRDRVGSTLCNQLQGKFINLVSQLGWICIHSGQSWIRHEIPEVQRLVNSCAALQHHEWHSCGMTKIYLKQSWLLLQTQAAITLSTHASLHLNKQQFCFSLSVQFSRMFCPLVIPLRAAVTNNSPTGKRLLWFARRMKHLYPGLTARERCLKKAFK